MATSSTVMVLFCIILCAQALEQRPSRARRSKRDTMASSMFSAFINVDKRLAALEAKMEQKMQEKQQHMEERLQSVQDGMQRLESMVMELLSSRLEAMEQKVAELVEAKTNATEERLASLEASNTEAQASPASCRYQYLYRYEKEAPRSSGDQQRMTKLETELTRLQEKVSALDSRLQDNEDTLGSLHNASVLAMEDLVDSLTQLVVASEQSIKSTMETTVRVFNEGTTTMMNDTKTQLLATTESNTAAINASIARIAQTTKELASHVAAVENKLNNATSLQAEEAENTRTWREDFQRRIEDLKNHTAEVGAPLRYRRTCQDYYNDGQRTSGVYTLLLEYAGSVVEVYCEMNNGTGWVVFQRRQDGSVDFYRDWQTYEYGFGDLNGEFWLGNNNIRRLTSAGLTHLRVDLQAWNGSRAFATYTHFSVGDASSSYRLSVSGYSGNAGDSLKHNNGRQFSTFDQDHDTNSVNCAQVYKGAWWYGSCTHANLNAEYGSRGSSGVQYVYWWHWLSRQSLQHTELKLK